MHKIGFEHGRMKMIQSSFSKPLWVNSQTQESGFERVGPLESSRRFSDDEAIRLRPRVQINATLIDGIQATFRPEDGEFIEAEEAPRG